MLLITNGGAQPDRVFSMGLSSGDTAPRPRSILYCGRAERVFHNPVEYYQHSRRSYAERGLRFTFTDKIWDLNIGLLSQYDGLLMYGDVQTAANASEAFAQPFVDAIVDFVEAGGGLTGMHVASACFRNSTDFGNLLGGRFSGHFPYQSFSPNVPNLVEHPITEGLGTYTSFDEPYQIKDLNSDVVLLGTRNGIGNEADDRPYTWVRTQGAGRVFYHANGHDSSSWEQPNFQELMLRGTEWAARTGSTDFFGEIWGAILAESGEVSFMSKVEVDGNLEQGVFSGVSDSPYRAVLSGESLFDEPSAGTFLNSSETSAVVVGSGMIAMTGRIDRVGVSGDSAAFLFGPPQCPHLIAASGLECSEAGLEITYAGVAEFVFETSNLDEVVVRAALDNPNTPQNDAILLHTDGVVTTKVLMEGDVLPEGSEVVSDLTNRDFALSDGGLLVLISQLSENGESSEAIISDRSGTLEVNLRSGVQYPNLPLGSTIESFDWVEIRDSGEILFIASLSGVGVTSSNDQMLCRLSSIGEVTLIVREGDFVDEGVVKAPVDGWKVACSESHLAIVMAYVRQGEMQEIGALVLVSDTAVSVALTEGDKLADGDEIFRVKFLPGEKASCEGAESVMKVSLEGDVGPASEALLLLGRLKPRIIVRTSWQLGGRNGSFKVDELDFEPDSHGQAGHSSSSGLVFTASAPDGTKQIVLSDLGDSLDGDFLDDDFEIAFGGNPNFGDGLMPIGTPKIEAEADGAYSFNFWMNKAFVGQYEIFESRDLKSWTKVESAPTLHQDQSNVVEGFDRFSHHFELSDIQRFLRIEIFSE